MWPRCWPSQPIPPAGRHRLTAVAATDDTRQTRWRCRLPRLPVFGRGTAPYSRRSDRGLTLLRSRPGEGVFATDMSPSARSAGPA